ncbi:hypothetical protein ACHAPJ_008166 [Fusarium lateritium]
MDDSKNPIGQHEIVQYAETCKGLFIKLEAHISDKEKALYQPLLDQQELFIQWVENLKLSANTSGSSALVSAKHPDIRSTLVRLLEMIERNLRRRESLNRLVKSIEDRATRLAGQGKSFSQLSGPRENSFDQLEPYVCLAPDCNESPPTFPSQEAWLQHVEYIHSHATKWIEALQNQQVWFCDMDLSNPCVETFKTSAELRLHVAEVHQRILVPSLEIASMLERNTMTMNLGSKVCPFCHLDVNAQTGWFSLEDPSWSLTGTDKSEDTSVLKHIFMHMESLALLSISSFDAINTPGEESHHMDHATHNARVFSEGQWSQLRNAEPWEDSVTSLKQATVPDDSRTEKVDKIPSLEMLEDMIFEYRTESPFDARYFFPRSCLELITRATITTVLDYPERSLVDFIEKQAKVCFAVLVTIGVDVERAITAFSSFNLTDRCLPIPKDVIHDNYRTQGSDRDCNHSPELSAFHHQPWSRRTISDFYDKQWEFLVPIFTLNKFEYHLDGKAVLPIISVDSDRKSGVFGDVSKVAFPKEQMDILEPVSGNSRWIALKEYRKSTSVQQDTGHESRRVFEQEVHALKEMKKINHSHILSVIAAIHRDERECILFPWADGGSLRDLLAGERVHEKLTGVTILQTIEQILGLCDGLATLHGALFRHGDVKPENILRFTDQAKLPIGNLKLADFGITSRHEVRTDERDVPTGTRLGTLRYEGPEAEVTTQTNPRSRRYDVWSMGCVILEVVIWLFYGPDGLQTFDDGLEPQGGSFYVTKKKQDKSQEVSINPVVEDWMSYICQGEPEAGEDTALGDLIRFVRGEMLVPQLFSMPVSAPLNKDSIPPPSEVRASSEKVVTVLEKLFMKSNSNSRYLIPELDPVHSHNRQLPTFAPSENATLGVSEISKGPVYRSWYPQVLPSSL